MWGWRPRRPESGLGKPAVAEREPEPAVGQEAGGEPARPFSGLPGPEAARFEQTRSYEAIQLPGSKVERKQNETRFG